MSDFQTLNDVSIDDQGLVQPSAAAAPKVHSRPPPSSKPGFLHNVRSLRAAAGGLALLVVVLGIGIAVMASGGGSGCDATAAPGNTVDPPDSIAAHISADNMWKTFHGLYDVAMAHGGTRSMQLGANASVAYIKSRIDAETDFITRVDTFDVDSAELQSSSLSMVQPTPATYTYGEDYSVRQGAGTLNGVQAMYLPNGGCNVPADVAGKIAVVIGDTRACGGMTTQRQAIMDANAAALLYYYEGQELIVIDPDGARTVPIFFVSPSVGADLVKRLSGGETVTMSLTSVVRYYTVVTTNLVVDTPSAGGDPNNIVVVGSHIDSVPAGPGMNDDGSGSTANLEIALQLYKLRNVINMRNRARFVFVGAEELGLLGSFAYVRQQVAMNTSWTHVGMLDLDMLASPNGAYQVYNASSHPNAESTLKGNTHIQQLFAQRLAMGGENVTYIPFDGRSDYEAFLQAGIPAGGITTGAEVIKTMHIRDMFGGLANAAYDPCYHLKCDDLSNVDRQRHVVSTRAAAFTAESLFTDPNIRATMGRPL